MGIFVDKKTRVVVQGITGHHGSVHTRLMLEYGTKIVSGVTPGKGGQSVEGLPVYNSVAEAKVANPDVSWSIIFVPAGAAVAAAREAMEADLHLIMITEHVPVLDALGLVREAKQRGLFMLGPNCPGVITPEECKLGIMPGEIFKKGNVGVVSRSGTLTYEIAKHLTHNGIGQSTVLGIGGDPAVGLDFVDVLKLFEADPETEKIVLIGEIGGDAEERAAKFIQEKISKKVVAYIAGKTAPKGKVMGHAGAVISGGTGTFESKVKALTEAGIEVVDLPSDVVLKLIKQ